MGVRRKRIVQCVGILLVSFLCFQFVSCVPKERTPIRFWHSYTGSQAETLTKMVAAYNETEGKERGVEILAYYKAPAEELSENLQDMPISKLPNMIQVSDEAAYLAYLNGRIVSAESYLSKETLSQYVPGFLESGRFTLGGGTYIFPLQSSLEVMYLNADLFETFRAAHPQFHLGDLRTWDGIYELAEAYYAWSDGRSFMAIEDIGSYLMTVSNQHTASIVQTGSKGVRIVLNYEMLEEIWHFIYEGALQGYISISDESLNRQMQQQQLVCYLASTESAKWAPTTYQDLEGQAQTISLRIRPYPSVTASYVVVPHRVSGVVVVNQNSAVNEEAYHFLDWLCGHELAYQFCAEGKRLPVRQDILQDTQTQMKLSDALSGDRNANVSSVYTEAYNQAAFLNTYRSTVFYGSESLVREMGTSLSKAIQEGVLAVSELMQEGHTRAEAISMIDTEADFKQWIQNLEIIQGRYSAGH